MQEYWEKEEEERGDDSTSHPAHCSPPARGLRFRDVLHPGPILKLSPPLHRYTSLCVSLLLLFPFTHGHLVLVDIAVFCLLSTAMHPLFQYRSLHLPAPPLPSPYHTTLMRST
ncbi:hypothetical protein B0H14DRAFT_3476757 [Mycena olivaceomarginata]|nr:hypothetical protein B0H14DRAFT_3476757 [Mycena olivaceomarginata]